MNALRKILIKTDDSHFDIHVQHRRGELKLEGEMEMTIRER